MTRGRNGLAPWMTRSAIAATLASPLSAIAQAPAAAPPAEPAAAAAPAPAPTTPAAEPAKPPAAEPAKKLAVGKEGPGAFFAPGVLLQGWFIDDTSSPTSASGESVTVSASTFRIRRAELSASGEIVAGAVKYKVMLDPARVRDTLTTATAVDASGAPVVVRTPASPLSTLQDLYITVMTPYADVSIGQFKIPVSWEGVNSSGKILLPERAFVSTLLGDKRDVGVRLEKTFAKWGYMAGVWNGASLNNLDNNNQKDVALRLEVYPVKGLTIAGVTYDSVGYRTRAGTKDRWEGDVRYDSGPLLVQAEYIRARDVGASGAAVTGHGFYAALGYKLGKVGDGAFRGELQPVLRVAYFDPDVSVDLDPATVPASNTGGNDERVDYAVGLNYYLRGHEMKLQAVYERQQFDQKTANNQVIVAAQVTY